MQNKTPLVAGVVVLLILIGIAVYLSKHPKTAIAPSTETSSTTATPTGNAVVGATGQSQVITYSDKGFSPANITIAEGTTVTWSNSSARPMWVASDSHPSHAVYDGTSVNQHCVSGAATSASVFDECSAIPSGGSYSFTFTKAGTWSFHNHAHPSDTGTIVVTAGQPAAGAGALNPNATPN
ncbi:MAG: plastocyanin/azurin family copper-binding protein [Candidatus Paceibacterota bacterium]